jgi:hypothetical protein
MISFVSWCLQTVSGLFVLLLVCLLRCRDVGWFAAAMIIILNTIALLGGGRSRGWGRAGRARVQSLNRVNHRNVLIKMLAL